MPYKNPEDRRKNWNRWHGENHERFLQDIAVYREKNRQKIRANQQAYYKKLRLAAVEHYGGKCACCGEDRIEFLGIDHIEGRGAGAAHRREVGVTGGSWFYLWLQRNDYPDGLRVLCHNCNSSLGYYGYCPHNQASAWREDLARHQDLQAERVISCTVCGSEYKTTSAKSRFCSSKCQQRDWRARKRATSEVFG